MSEKNLLEMFTMEEEAVLVKEFRRPDKELLLRLLRDGQQNIEQPELENSKNILFNPEEELNEIYEGLIEKIEKLSEDEIRDLFDLVPMYSNFE